MNIREAILKAADYIHSSPDMWRFGNCSIPECGTPGCAAGWVGYFLGVEAGKSLNYAFPDVDYNMFSRRMDDLRTNWYFESSIAADTLRLYADKYHPAELSKPSLPSGAEICKLIISKPYRESATACPPLHA